MKKIKEVLLKVVAISDTHSLHNEVILPKSDLLIHAGDFTNVGSILDVEYFLKWFSKQTHKYKILIAGNHDFFCQKKPAEFRVILKDYPSIIYLEDSFTIIEGFKIYGSPYTPFFNDWAFMLERGDEIKTAWDKIPEDVDILVTHGPARGHLDIVERGGIPWNYGCKELADAIKRVKPLAHIFGHIHDSHGQETQDDICYFNASTCTENYEPINEPICFTLRKNDRKSNREYKKKHNR